MRLQPVKIRGYHKAYLAVADTLPQRELGTVCQVKPRASWSVYKGIGGAAAFVGNAPSKELALALLENHQA